MQVKSKDTNEKLDAGSKEPRDEHARESSVIAHFFCIIIATLIGKCLSQYCMHGVLP